MIARYQVMQEISVQQRLERNDEFGAFVKFEEYERLRAELAEARTKLAHINRICAEAPPCHELGEDNDIYDSILDSIQKQTRVGSQSAGTPK